MVFESVDILIYVCVEPLILLVIESGLLNSTISLKHLTLVVIRRNEICGDALFYKLEPSRCVHLRLNISVVYALYTWLKVFVFRFSFCACIDKDYHILRVIFFECNFFQVRANPLRVEACGVAVRRGYDVHICEEFWIGGPIFFGCNFFRIVIRAVDCWDNYS